jgi:hypothetical protein
MIYSLSLSFGQMYDMCMFIESKQRPRSSLVLSSSTAPCSPPHPRWTDLCFHQPCLSLSRNRRDLLCSASASTSPLSLALRRTLLGQCLGSVVRPWVGMYRDRDVTGNLGLDRPRSRSVSVTVKLGLGQSRSRSNSVSVSLGHGQVWSRSVSVTVRHRLGQSRSRPVTLALDVTQLLSRFLSAK